MQARKAHSLIGQIYDPRNLARAWERVKKNKGAGGVDGVTFLGLVGTVFGLVYANVSEPHREMLLNLAMAVGLLALGAAIFGTLARGLIAAGVWLAPTENV